MTRWRWALFNLESDKLVNTSPPPPEWVAPWGTGPRPPGVHLWRGPILAQALMQKHLPGEISYLTCLAEATPPFLTNGRGLGRNVSHMRHQNGLKAWKWTSFTTFCWSQNMPKTAIFENKGPFRVKMENGKTECARESIHCNCHVLPVAVEVAFVWGISWVKGFCGLRWTDQWCFK